MVDVSDGKNNVRANDINGHMMFKYQPSGAVSNHTLNYRIQFVFFLYNNCCENSFFYFHKVNSFIVWGLTSQFRKFILIYSGWEKINVMVFVFIYVVGFLKPNSNWF